LYTGVPEVKIPIYTISHDGYNLPIYLKYHGSSIPLDKIAGEFGMNWSLQGGGVITRKVVGMPDDNANYYSLKEIKEDEEDKEVQKKLEKIGTPGNRNIEDLLASFKVNKKEKGEIKDVDQLEDNSWDYDVAVGKGKSHSW
jgi:hypothetical protein